MIREHLRSHVIAYVALFVALSGTAIADHPGGADTISSEDIINGEVKATDISNTNGVGSPDVRDDTEPDGGLAAVDLAADSVGRSELLGGAVGTFEIGAGEVLSRNIGVGEVNGGDLANDAVASSEIRDGTVGRFEIDADAVGVSEIATDAVGGAEIGSDAVGPVELASVHEHRDAVFFSDEVAHDGLYALGSVNVECGPNEDLLGASINWGDGGADVGHAEKMLANVPVLERNGTDSATVQGAFDGGGGEDEPASFEAVATCIG